MMRWIFWCFSQDDTPVEVSEEQEQVGNCGISFQPFKIGAGVRIKH
jgi:hypothetical protein